MRPPPDATDYLVPNNPGSQTNSNYSMATEKTELLSPDTCSTLSCVPDDKLLELEDQMHMQNRNNVKLWNDDVLAHQQMMPFNVNMNVAMNNYPGVKPPFNAGIVLNPTSLNYQQPCVRYVNVNVNSDGVYNGPVPMDGTNPAGHMAANHLINEQSANNQSDPNKTPVNC